MKFLATIFPCTGLTHPAHLSLNKMMLVFFTAWVVLLNYRELDHWLGWSSAMCKCSYKPWLGWQVLTAESDRNLEICHLGLFVGDNESKLPQALFFFFQKLKAFSFVRTSAFFRLSPNGCSAACSPATVTAVGTCEENKWHLGMFGKKFICIEEHREVDFHNHFWGLWEQNEFWIRAHLNLKMFQRSKISLNPSWKHRNVFPG